MDSSLDIEELTRLKALTEKQRNYALTLYAGREKKKTTAYVLWVIFAVYYFYLGKPVKNILLWLTSTIFIGVIWWFIDLFRISGMVKEANRKILDKCISEALILYPNE